MTSGKFWKESQDFLEELGQGKLKSSRLNVGYGREALIALLLEYDFKKEVKIINKFFP